MLEEYSRLPTAPPSGCFVCTAVAGGHRRVVRGEEFLGANGSAYRVNDQLRVLKALELLLMSVSPQGHLACRWVYDRLGPRLATMLVHPLLADMGYFAETGRMGCAGLLAWRYRIRWNWSTCFTVLRLRIAILIITSP